MGSDLAPGRFAAGDAWVDSVIGAIEERIIWSRFGL